MGDKKVPFECQFTDVMFSLILLLTTFICFSKAQYPVGYTTVSNNDQTESTRTTYVQVQITQTQQVYATITLSSDTESQPDATVTPSSFSTKTNDLTNTLQDSLTNSQMVSDDTFMSLSGTPSIDGSASKTTALSTKFSPSPTSFTSSQFFPTNTNALYWASFVAIHEFITQNLVLYTTYSVLANNSELANAVTSADLMWSELVEPSMSAKENVWTNGDVTRSLYNYYTSIYNDLPSDCQQSIEKTIIGHYNEVVSTVSQETNTTQIPQQWSDYFEYEVCQQVLAGDVAGGAWDEAAELFK
ncbi:unnamed protein product [Ambrosiozyma monospora]|uniref:Unnamed protein product n=1 Tax=Ambrosiozyma monospora TaxID=43982 RepID=A0ACB5U9E6_AMBMO|nr:unnamed protein product [Ambrosiozyma monospora]